MKQLKAIILSAVVFSSILSGGCQTTDGQMDNKTEATQTTKDVWGIAWNSLSDSQKKEVIGEWKEAQVSKTVADTNGFALTNRSFERIVQRGEKCDQSISSSFRTVFYFEAKKLGLEKVLITCDKVNIGSAKTIQKVGGILENEVISPDTGEFIQRYWIEL